MGKICRGMVGLAEMIRDDTAEVTKTRDHIAVIKHYNHIRIANETIKEARKALDQMEEELSRETVPEVMRENSVKTTTVEGVGRVTISARTSCSMIDKELGMEWLTANGHGGMIQPTVNASTLGAFAKSQMEEGRELPVDRFKTSLMTYTSITKVK
jgi:hypothetical protein